MSEATPTRGRSAAGRGRSKEQGRAEETRDGGVGRERRKMRGGGGVSTEPYPETPLRVEASFLYLYLTVGYHDQGHPNRGTKITLKRKHMIKAIGPMKAHGLLPI